MNKKSNYVGTFCVQNEIFDMNISSASKLVYTYLSKCADCFGKSWPAHKTVAAACSVSVTVVKAALAELKAAKLITFSARYREEGGKSSNLYMIMNYGKTKAFWMSSSIFLKNVSAKAKLIYTYFCRCKNQEGTCFPSHKTTSEKCNMAISSCRKAIKELLDNTLILIERRTRKDNGQTSNLYTIVNAAARKVKEFVAKEDKPQEQSKENMEKNPVSDSGMEHINPRKKSLLEGVWSYFSRGHRNILAGGVPKCDYEELNPREPLS